MPRVRWCGSPLSALCLFGFWIATASADCWYDDKNHDEGLEVATAEPCLNCTCSRGALLCYLRVCPKLPNPPPPGCILLHRYRTCCPELICADVFFGGNGLEARSEPDNVDLPYDKSVLDNACVSNGSIYGPGSAMDSSSLCEYCYCLGGNQTCVKPKCLLPIEGCTPMYEPTNCCPIHYNCTSLQPTTSTTTTDHPKEVATGGCVVDGVFYKEGGKVLGVGHSVCDNCYCLRGILRCEPLSCAPPLLGCSPVVRPGECCAASYNCSGTIEIQLEPHYGQYPIVSKEYAKLRKEVQMVKSNKNSKHSSTEDSNSPFYVIAETSPTTKTQRSPGTFGTTRHFTGTSFNPSTTKPFYYNSMVEENLSTSENKHATRSYPQNKFAGIYYATTNYEFQSTNYKRPYSTTSKPRGTESGIYKTINSVTTTNYKEPDDMRSTNLFGLNDETLLSIVDDLLETRLHRRVEAKNETDETTTISTTETTEETSTFETTTEFASTTEDVGATSNSSPLVTVTSVLNSTDCTDGSDAVELRHDAILEATTILPIDVNEINKLEIVKDFDDGVLVSSEESSVETTTNEDVTEVDLESRVKVASATLRSIPKVPLEIETILNITKNKSDDYEYDYNEPSLPPSLPNLRIIPFVAADALDSKKDKHNAIYSPQERVTETSFSYTNLFSPPIETEGGFIPKDPPILDNFYENAVTAPSITNAPKREVGCLSEGREIAHGEPVTSESSCMACNCFYGNVVCQKVPCPNPRPGCRKSSVQDLTLCCPHYVCDDEEAPTVVLDRLEGTSNSQEAVTVAEGINTPDPFRDVIRTEAAPDLQSLIVDMMPFLARKTTPISPQTTEKPPTTPPPVNRTQELISDDDSFSFDKVFQLLFSSQSEAKAETTTTPPLTTTTGRASGEGGTTKAASMYGKLSVDAPIPATPLETRENLKQPLNSVNSLQGMGVLKLAGCNIYGRMYRVGRIISELSNPCLECKCTEIGVQCRPLKC